MMFSGETPYSLKEEIKLSMLAEVLNIKVIETLREDMSGVYGAGVLITEGSRGEGGYLLNNKG